MLQKFRNFSSGIIAKIFLSLILLSFVFWGMGDLYNSLGKNNTAAKVNGVSISSAAVEREAMEEISRIKKQFGGEIPAFLIGSIKSNVLDKIITRTILTNEAEDMNIHVSDARVAERIMTLFKDEKGVFSRANYDAYLAQSGKNDRKMAEEIRSDMTLNDLTSVIENLTYVSEDFAKTDFLIANEKRKVELYIITKDAIKINHAQPTDDEIQKKYDEIKQTFASPEYREVKYFTISAADMKGIEISDDELKSEYGEDFAKDKEKKIADLKKQKAEDLFYKQLTAMEEASASGVRFDEMVTQYSLSAKNLPLFDITGADEKGVKIVPAELKNFATVSFKGDANGAIQIIDGGKGVYYGVSVVAIKPSAIAELSAVRSKVAEAVMSATRMEALKKLADELNQIEDNNARLTRVESLAEKKITVIDRAGKNDVYQLPNAAVDEVFSGKIGSLTKSLTLNGGGFIFAKPITVIDAVYKADSEEAMMHKIKLQQEMKNKIFSEYIEALRKKQKVKLSENFADPNQYIE